MPYSEYHTPLVSFFSSYLVNNIQMKVVSLGKLHSFVLDRHPFAQDELLREHIFGMRIKKSLHRLVEVARRASWAIGLLALSPRHHYKGY